MTRIPLNGSSPLSTGGEDPAAYTGEDSDQWRGQLTGKNYAVAGNMLVGEETLKAMVDQFEKQKAAPLAERLLASLQAGQDAGGDKRGRQSAALKMVDTKEYPLLDLRADEHEDPVPELRRIYEVALQDLVPLASMMPTKANPAGRFDLEAARESGLLQD